MRNLVIILGDQLDPRCSAFDGFDPQQDSVWMAEVAEESTHVWSAKQRIAIFLSAMRHFALELHARNWPCCYRRLDDAANQGTLQQELASAIRSLQPVALVMTAPGDWRVLQALRSVAADFSLALDVRDDRHFFSTVREFSAFAKGRKELRLEFWYRELRRKHRVLIEPDARTPCGGAWNYDAENRESFKSAGPPPIAEPLRFAPDAITQEVINLVNLRFADHPGDLESFAWPVTQAHAELVLDDFIAHRLALFGRYEDAMWRGQPWLYHAQLSSSLNLKLLDPRAAVQRAEQAYRSGSVPLAAAEGFIRQILGWREFVRGIYWSQMPQYLQLNALEASAALPQFYWTGDTEMACLSEVIGQTLKYGYAHHIQRLMVTGLYALLYGVDPKHVHEWYLSVYVDAVEWVELPNTLGMSQFGDGGLMASKAYAASGKYIQRMSNYCRGCRFDPELKTGARACPFTTLYWDFLLRNEERLEATPRMRLQLKHLDRLDAESRQAIFDQAALHRDAVSTLTDAKAPAHVSQ